MDKTFLLVKQCATDNMLSNVIKVRVICNSDTGECGVSIDGTWQKQGYSSHGVVTAISLETKKYLDVEVLSDKCQ